MELITQKLNNRIQIKASCNLTIYYPKTFITKQNEEFAIGTFTDDVWCGN